MPIKPEHLDEILAGYETPVPQPWFVWPERGGLWRLPGPNPQS
jgi:hypothetical protein